MLHIYTGIKYDLLWYHDWEKPEDRCQCNMQKLEIIDSEKYEILLWYNIYIYDQLYVCYSTKAFLFQNIYNYRPRHTVVIYMAKLYESSENTKCSIH